MNTKRIAIISDIHGNSLALREVLKDIKARHVDKIINLGDTLYGPLNPKETYEILIENDIISISGNQDRFILENFEQETDIETLEYVKSELERDMINWLRKQPFDVVIDDQMYGCHASPGNDSVYLLEDLQNEYVGIKPYDVLDDLLKNIKQRIILCGHSHVPNIVQTKNKLIINPGSVGLQAYDDDLPVFHKMENFNPLAKYSILYFSDDSVKIEQVSIPYNFEKAAQIAEKNNRGDWAKWIRSGRV